MTVHSHTQAHQQTHRRDRSMEHLKRVKPKGEAPFMEPTGLNFTFDNVFTPEHDNAAVYDKVCGVQLTMNSACTCH